MNLTFAIPLSLHNRAHENLDGANVLQWDFTLTRKFRLGRYAEQKNGTPFQSSDITQDDASAPPHSQLPVHQFCYQEQGKEPLRVPRWRGEHRARLWTR